MTDIVYKEVKINQRKYKVEVHFYEKKEHQCVSYAPIPESTELRLEIDEKIKKWVPYYTK